MPIDEGDGMATVNLGNPDQSVADKLAKRTASDPESDPETGADLGAGPGAGLVTGENLGGAKNIQETAEAARTN